MRDEEAKTVRKPFFSVIVPAHNSEEYIMKGLQSIMDQDFEDYELIVVCDSCTDRTALAAYMFTDDVIYTDFHSAGGARNAGLDAAKGEWVLFMDDDDWYLPGAFSRIAEAVKSQEEIDLLAFGFDWKGRGPTMQSRGRLLPAVWNKAWRRDFIGEERFIVAQHTEDLDFARRMHPQAWTGFLYEVLYHYEFMRPGSVSDRIRKGEYDNNLLPENVRDAAEGYERWLKKVVGE